MAEELDLVPMPANVVAAIEGVWSNDIKDGGSKPLYAVSH
jgi:phosphate transport system substrate-binding protein